MWMVGNSEDGGHIIYKREYYKCDFEFTHGSFTSFKNINYKVKGKAYRTPYQSEAQELADKLNGESDV